MAQQLEAVMPKPQASSRLPSPNIDGPRMHHFNADNDHDPCIEFLEVIGSGLHSNIVKAKIDGKVYAVKIVSSS